MLARLIGLVAAWLARRSRTAAIERARAHDHLGWSCDDLPNARHH